MTIPEGAFVAIERKTGRIVLYRTYTKTEQMIRWIGRMLRSQTAMQYHELTPIGVMRNGRVVVRSKEGWAK